MKTLNSRNFVFSPGMALFVSLSLGTTALADNYSFKSMDPTGCVSIPQSKTDAKGQLTGDLPTLIPGAKFPQYTMADPTCKKTPGDAPITYCIQLANCPAIFQHSDDNGADLGTVSLHTGAFLSCEAVTDPTDGNPGCPSASICAKSKVEISYYDQVNPILRNAPPAGAKARSVQ